MSASLLASIKAFASYDATVVPVLGTDPTAVDARGVEAALDAVLAKRCEERDAQRWADHNHLEDLALQSYDDFVLHYQCYLRWRVRNAAGATSATRWVNADDGKDDRISGGRRGKLFCGIGREHWADGTL